MLTRMRDCPLPLFVWFLLIVALPSQVCLDTFGALSNQTTLDQMANIKWCQKWPLFVASSFNHYSVNWQFWLLFFWCHLPDFSWSESWTEVVQFAFILLAHIADVRSQEIYGANFVATRKITNRQLPCCVILYTIHTSRKRCPSAIKLK